MPELGRNQVGWPQALTSIFPPLLPSLSPSLSAAAFAAAGAAGLLAGVAGLAGAFELLVGTGTACEAAEEIPDTLISTSLVMLNPFKSILCPTKYRQRAAKL